MVKGTGMEKISVGDPTTALLRFPNSVIDRNFRGICDLLEEKAAERMLCFS